MSATGNATVADFRIGMPLSSIWPASGHPIRGWGTIVGTREPRCARDHYSLGITGRGRQGWAGALLRRLHLRLRVGRRLWPHHRNDLVHDGVVGVAAARDRAHRGGIEAAILDEAIVDVDADHLSERDVAMRRLAIEILEIDDLQKLAFQRTGRRFDARGPYEPRGHRLESGLDHLIDAARIGDAGGDDRSNQVEDRQIADEFLGLRDEGERIL